MIDTVLLNGTVGAGKTTTAGRISALLGDRDILHGVIDLDALRLLFPAPRRDPFQHELEMRNLRDVARNYREAGAGRLVLAGVVEDPAEVPRYREASGSAGLLLVRLVVDPAEGRDRLRRRHEGAPGDLQWHLDRAPVLHAILETAGFDELVVDTTGQDTTSVATEIADAAGW